MLRESQPWHTIFISTHTHKRSRKLSAAQHPEQKTTKYYAKSAFSKKTAQKQLNFRLRKVFQLFCSINRFKVNLVQISEHWYIIVYILWFFRQWESCGRNRVLFQYFSESVVSRSIILCFAQVQILSIWLDASHRWSKQQSMVNTFNKEINWYSPAKWFAARKSICLGC